MFREPVPRLGIGVGGALAWSWVTSAECAMGVLRSAYEGGIRYFDTGHAYCGGNAERLLGRFLREVSADDAFVATKLGTHVYGKMGGVVKDFRQSSLEASLHISLRRLGLPSVSCLMLHSPCNSDLDRGLAFLEAARQRGLTRLIGASIEPTQLTRPELQRCDLVMVRYGSSGAPGGELLRALRGKGVRVVAKSAIRRSPTLPRVIVPRGLTRADLWYWARDIRDFAMSRREPKTPKFHGLTPAAAIGKALNDVDAVVFGTVKAEHARANARAVRAMGIDISRLAAD